MLDAHWRPEGGYTVPNAAVYPCQWLWDSCFHAVVWAELGERRPGPPELAHLFRTQDAARLRAPHRLRARSRPPRRVLGRAAAVVDHPAADVRPRRGRARRAGGRVVDDLVDAGRRGAAVPARRTGARADGLVALVPPVGERGATTARGGTTGAPADGTPAAGTTSRASWWPRVEHAPYGSPLANPAFEVAAAGSTRWSRSTPASWPRSPATQRSAAGADALVDALDAPVGRRRSRTWVDAGDSRGDAPAGRARSTRCCRCS